MSFGFDPESVFGGSGLGNGRFKKKKSKKKDDMGSMMDESMQDLGFGFNVLEIGGDFGERVVRPAGRANGRQGGFLDIVGMQQLGIPQIAGREPTVAGARRAKKAKRKGRKVDTPLTGLEGFGRGVGSLERVSTTVRGDVGRARKGIKRFREARKLTKQRKAEEKRRRQEERRRRVPALPEIERPVTLESGFRSRPALPAPPPSPRGSLPAKELTRGQSPT